MALFTDGPAASIDDLTAQDSQLLNVASVEGIDVTQKLALAQDQISLELTTMLTRLSYVDQLFWLAPQPNIGSVVVTPSLKLWHAFRTLEMVYTDAYNSQLNDRYAGRRDQFHEAAKWAYEKLQQIGVGMVTFPLAQAVTPNAVATPGNLPDGTYYVTLAWLNTAGEEGAPAVATAVSTTGSTFLVQPGPAPQNAVAWNVYAGTDPNALELQNASPIAAGQTWVQPGTVTTGGRAPGTGQEPNYTKPLPRVIQRG
ncbi:MAG TPA: hypothetical protein VLY04_17130 [Bryobacteraceae bacterium]|nr:hypothetical protein [Bryobacteraceae bacterium]